MQISIDQSKGLERIVSIDLEADAIQSKVDAKLNELGKEVRLKGFRQGRVPKKILKQRFGQHARQEVLGEMMQNSIEQALEDNKLNIVSPPEVTDADDKEDGGFSFKAKVELMPEVPEIDFSVLEVEKVVAEVSDDDIDNMIKNLQKQKQDWKESKGKITNGDLVTIEYKTNGEVDYPVEGTEKMGVLLGESNIPADLKKALVGLKVKESAEIEADFPENFNVSELAGKRAKIIFDVADVRKAKLPKVDEDFVKSFGVESGDVEEFKGDIKKNLERELSQSVKNTFKSNALEALRSACKETLLPESMIKRESQHMAHQAQQRAKQMGIKEPKSPEADGFLDEASQRILNTLIIQKIAKDQDIKTDFAKVREQINDIAQTFEKPEEVVQMYYKNSELMASVEQNVMENQVMDWIESQVKIKQRVKSFDDIMKPQG